ncbi:PorP/SprF family type IX secretion system membrane protein [Foetidibacter luteolus]|uniref:PorP/SprF family type IX secretion system membrane protein n=1 Tax=Foetidibacter luteolus TaxID=2608880 RepID=UPI00129A8101|nr:PorP/SprF family type IX secretion system membrane protein [Foetidibacter luteolus]
MNRTLHYYKVAALAIAVTITAAITHAQDLHFSQYFNTPLLVNPANTGFAPDVDWRVGINYRNQWASVINNPYKTMSAWGDVQLFNNTFDNGWLGVGGALLRDVAGTGGLTSTRAYGSIAYHQLLGLNSLLSTGFNIGYSNKRVDFSKLTFDNQWNGEFFDITIPNNEPFAYSSVSYFDLQAGMNYAYFPNDNTYYNVGLSVSHINRPRESFFSSNSLTDQRLAMRFNLFLNGAFKLNDQWIVNPNAYISKMGNAWETVIGLNANYNLSGDGNTQLIGGIYYRANDAFIPMVGYQLADFKLTVNYDVTSSLLKSYNQSRGAYELSLVKTGLYSSGGKAVKCPTVRF